MNLNLPKTFEEQMKQLLGEEYPKYLETFASLAWSGLRVNTAKISVEEFLKISPFSLTPIPWIENGFYCSKEEALAKHPYYFAGLYYLQEPSAMTPANRLPICKGDKVLDLCAAPGGKATELAAKLRNQGVLVANDISNSRAKALLKNLEMQGARNICVTSEEPKKLVEEFPEYFDKILIDAPCSGEGMFHKETSMMKFWEERGPQYYSPIQRELLMQGAKMLRPDGMMLFSTCTFSREEDEDSIEWLLKERDDMELVEIAPYEEFSKGFLEKCVRLWPHKIHGEGHFLALMHKKNIEDEASFKKLKEKKRKTCTFQGLPDFVQKFLSDIKWEFESGSFYQQEERLYYFQEEHQAYQKKLRYLRTGLFLGECKKNRFEPSQALAMALTSKAYARILDFQPSDIRVVKYLKGETILLENQEVGENGYCLICVSGYPLGWGKQTGQNLKNKYYTGWRWQ